MGDYPLLSSRIQCPAKRGVTSVVNRPTLRDKVINKSTIVICVAMRLQRKRKGTQSHLEAILDMHFQESSLSGIGQDTIQPPAGGSHNCEMSV